MNTQQIKEVLGDCEFKDWQFHVGEMGDGSYIQVQFMDKDIHSGFVEMQHGRKWYVSPHAIGGEIIKTAFLAVMQAMEHEIRETFRYKGKNILGPHIAIDALVNVADTREVRAA
jgi:hypothetical protein